MAFNRSTGGAIKKVGVGGGGGGGCAAGGTAAKTTGIPAINRITKTSLNVSEGARRSETANVGHVAASKNSNGVISSRSRTTPSTAIPGKSTTSPVGTTDGGTGGRSGQKMAAAENGSSGGGGAPRGGLAVKSTAKTKTPSPSSSRMAILGDSAGPTSSDHAQKSDGRSNTPTAAATASLLPSAVPKTTGRRISNGYETAAGGRTGVGGSKRSSPNTVVACSNQNGKTGPSAASTVTLGKRGTPVSSSDPPSKPQVLKVRKVTGIAKLQDVPSGRPQTTTTAPRSKAPPVATNVGTSSLSSSSSSSSVNHAKVSNVSHRIRSSAACSDANGNRTGTTNVSKRTCNVTCIEADARSRGSNSRDLTDNSASVAASASGNRSPIDDSPSSAVDSCTASSESRRSQDLTSWTFEDIVENVSECEYFSETRSTTSEYATDFADGDGEVGEDATNASANFSAPTTDDERFDDIFASCEDVCVYVDDTPSPRNSDQTPFTAIARSVPNVGKNLSSDLSTSTANSADEGLPDSCSVSPDVASSRRVVDDEANATAVSEIIENEREVVDLPSNVVEPRIVICDSENDRRAVEKFTNETDSDDDDLEITEEEDCTVCLDYSALESMEVFGCLPTQDDNDDRSAARTTDEIIRVYSGVNGNQTRVHDGGGGKAACEDIADTEGSVTALAKDELELNASWVNKCSVQVSNVSADQENNNGPDDNDSDDEDEVLYRVDESEVETGDSFVRIVAISEGRIISPVTTFCDSSATDDTSGNYVGENEDRSSTSSSMFGGSSNTLCGDSYTATSPGDDDCGDEKGERGDVTNDSSQNKNDFGTCENVKNSIQNTEMKAIGNFCDRELENTERENENIGEEVARNSSGKVVRTAVSCSSDDNHEKRYEKQESRLTDASQMYEYRNGEESRGAMGTDCAGKLRSVKKSCVGSQSRENSGANYSDATHFRPIKNDSRCSAADDETGGNDDFQDLSSVYVRCSSSYTVATSARINGTEAAFDAVSLSSDDIQLKKVRENRMNVHDDFDPKCSDARTMDVNCALNDTLDSTMDDNRPILAGNVDSSLDCTLVNTLDSSTLDSTLMNNTMVRTDIEVNSMERNDVTCQGNVVLQPPVDRENMSKQDSTSSEVEVVREPDETDNGLVFRGDTASEIHQMTNVSDYSRTEQQQQQQQQGINDVDVNEPEKKTSDLNSANLDDIIAPAKTPAVRPTKIDKVMSLTGVDDAAPGVAEIPIRNHQTMLALSINNNASLQRLDKESCKVAESVVDGAKVKFPNDQSETAMDDMKYPPKLNCTLNSSSSSSSNGQSLRSSVRGRDSSVGRAPSPLTVLTSNTLSVNGTSKTESVTTTMFGDGKSGVPPLSVCKFRPVPVKEYFMFNSNSSLNVSPQDGLPEKPKAVSADDKRKPLKDANHNNVIVSPSSPSSPSDSKVAVPNVLLSGFLSPHYIPSRPLSQICNRSINKILAKNVTAEDSSNSVESLNSAEIKSKDSMSNISDRIRFARSCSRIGGGGGSHTQSTEAFHVPGQEEHPSRGQRAFPNSSSSFELYRSSFCHNQLSPSLSSSTLSRTDSSRQSMSSTPVISPWGPSPCTTPTPFSSSSYLVNGLSTRFTTAGAKHNQHPLDDDVHGSFASLASASSSVYSSVEEKQTLEIRKLKQELEVANEKITSLSTQLNVNTMMSKTYEQNIDGLTQRLRQLTTIIDQKETELCELRTTLKIVLSRDGGGGGGGLETIPDCISLSSFQRKTPLSSTLPLDAKNSGLRYVPPITRHISCESVNSLNSQSSSCSMTSQLSATAYPDATKLKKKKSWIKNSISKAFSRKKSKQDSTTTAMTMMMAASEGDALSIKSDVSNHESTVTDSHATNGGLKSLLDDGGQLDRTFLPEGSATEWQDKLRECDAQLTELRLEVLSSFQRMEQQQDHATALEKEIATLKAENRSLQSLLVQLQQGVNGGAHQSQQGTNAIDSKRISNLTRQASVPTNPSFPVNNNGHGVSTIGHDGSTSGRFEHHRYSLVDDSIGEQLHRVSVVVATDMWTPESAFVNVNLIDKKDEKQTRQVGHLMLSDDTSWQALDEMIGNVFLDYLQQLDPETRLGLNETSVARYELGTEERLLNKNATDCKTLETVPARCLPGANSCIKVYLCGWQENSLDYLAFDTLVPKPLLQQYVSLLLENRRLLFCGPSLSGKTFLVKKLARYLALRVDKTLSSNSVSQFTVDSKSNRELQQYMNNVVCLCEQTSDHLPSVIIIDNLHLADNLAKVFSGFFSLDSHSCPFLIGTMNQSRTLSPTSLQFHQNFRWVLFAPAEEPVKSLLARHLRRQLAERQFRFGSGENDDDCRRMSTTIEWMPNVWQHVNKFVASHCSPDKCIGPGIFMSCPMDVVKSQVWFADTWNYSIGPFLLQLIKESSNQGNIQRSNCEDPVDWVLETSPWDDIKQSKREAGSFPLLRLFPPSGKQLSREDLTEFYEEMCTKLNREPAGRTDNNWPRRTTTTAFPV